MRMVFSRLRSGFERFGAKGAWRRAFFTLEGAIERRERSVSDIHGNG